MVTHQHQARNQDTRKRTVKLFCVAHSLTAALRWTSCTAGLTFTDSVGTFQRPDPRSRHTQARTSLVPCFSHATAMRWTSAPLAVSSRAQSSLSLAEVHTQGGRCACACISGALDILSPSVTCPAITLHRFGRQPKHTQGQYDQ